MDGFYLKDTRLWISVKYIYMYIYVRQIIGLFLIFTQFLSFELNLNLFSNFELVLIFLFFKF